MWADRFDGERSQLGELQVEAVSRLARSLGVELVKAEALRAMRERPSSPDAADLAMQADAKSNLPPSKTNLNDVVTLSERALRLDPQSEWAMFELAESLVNRALNRWSDDPAGDIARAEKTIDAALALQPEDSWAHFTKGQIYFAKRQLGQSNTEFETAIALDPNNANAHAFVGFLRVFFGRAEDGPAEIDTAFRLSPRDPSAPWWQFYMCVVRNHLEQWEQAIPWCEKSIAGIPQVFFPYVELAAAYAWAGHDKEAKETVAQLQKVQPGYTVQTWAGRHMQARIRPTRRNTSAASKACARPACRRARRKRSDAAPALSSLATLRTSLRAAMPMSPFLWGVGFGTSWFPLPDLGDSQWFVGSIP